MICKYMQQLFPKAYWWEESARAVGEWLSTLWACSAKPQVAVAKHHVDPVYGKVAA